MHGALEDMVDEELARLVQGNNTDAFGVLLSRYQPKLLRYGRKFMAREEHIEDVVQEIFIKAYQNIESFDVSRSFSPWIYRIAHNAFANALRQRSREPIIFLDLDTLVAHPSYERDPAGEEERAHMQSLVSQGLEALSSSHREVLVLYYLEELSYQEIADVLRVPIGTVGVRLSRAREALKKYVDR
jgi:RNA polymerase sigma-70 factor (ECF subfamily)